MKIITKLVQASLVGILALGISSTALADDRTRNTIIGAGLGGVAGALLSEGDPLYTIGGAAAGGVLGNVITRDDRDHKRHRWDRDRKHKHGHKYAYHPGKKYGHKKHWKHHR